MDRRDRELLDKQLRAIYPAPRNDGVMIVMIVAMFLAGMSLGGLLSAPRSAPMQVASNDPVAAALAPHNVAPVTPQFPGNGLYK